VNITVYCRPKIAIVSTGDELVDACDTPGDGRIRNSNEHVLESLIRTAHATPVVLGIARDDRRSLMDKLSVGLQSDVLCITGGVSMGTLDLVPGVLAELGVSIHVRRISIKPGRPTVFGTHPGGALVFALPGNPVSAFIAFELLVRPALAVMQGRSDECARPFAALLEGTMESTSHRRSYWPARAFVRNDGRWEAVKLPWQGSGDSFGMAKANALIVRPANSPAVSDGQEVSIHLLDRW